MCIIISQYNEECECIMKKIFIRIVSLILMICMLSTCVYATDSTVSAGNSESSTEYIKDCVVESSTIDEHNKVSLCFKWSNGADSYEGIDAELYKNLNCTEESLVDKKEIASGATEVVFDGLLNATPYYIVLMPYVKDSDNNKIYGKKLKNVGIYLAKPVIKNIDVMGTTVKVNFDSVNGANEYVISYENGGKEIQKNITDTTFTVSGLLQNTDYKFKVMPIYKNVDNNKEIYIYSGDWSESRSITTSVDKLGKPSLKIAEYNKGAILRWNKISGATGYEIWRCYNKKWTKIKTVNAKTLTYKNTGLKVNKKYCYKVRAIKVSDNGTIKSSYSSQKSITAKTYLTSQTIRLGYSSGTLWKPAKKYKAGSSTKIASKSLLKAGTKFTILERKKIDGKLMVNIKLSNGKKYWIRSGNISYGAPYTTKDYTTEVKENFVNKMGYSSKTKYLLFISCYTQKVYVFKGSKGNWDLQKTFKCCTGKASTRTPRGTFKLYKKAANGWCYKYVSYFKSRNSFHSRPYGSKTMGKPASNGCIRLYDNDAKYIYKSIPKNTTVVSY